MAITVNGKPRPLGDARTLAELLAALGVNISKKAVEHNGRIIPPSDLPTTPVADNDQVEIIQFVGGG